MSATLRIFTYREGLLSRFGHDLQLTFDRFRVELDGHKLCARFETNSLRVLGAMRGGKLDVSCISDGDREKIRKTAIAEVLLADRFPEATLEAAVDADAARSGVHATLTLAGRRLALPLVDVVAVDDEAVGSVKLRPSRWGIKPYRAMAGALKLKDGVDVELALPIESLANEGKRTWTP